MPRTAIRSCEQDSDITINWYYGKEHDIWQ